MKRIVDAEYVFAKSCLERIPDVHLQKSVLECVRGQAECEQADEERDDEQNAHAAEDHGDQTVTLDRQCFFRRRCFFGSFFSSLFSNLFSNLFDCLFSNLFSSLFSSLFSNLFSNLFDCLFSNLFSSLFSNLFSSLFDCLFCRLFLFLFNRFFSRFLCCFFGFYCFFGFDFLIGNRINRFFDRRCRIGGKILNCLFLFDVFHQLGPPLKFSCTTYYRPQAK